MPETMTARAPQMPAFDYQPRPYTGPTRDEVLAARRQYTNPAVFTLYREPLMIVEGRMQYLFDETGRRYLDLFAGIVTVSCGHCHPKVTARMREQLETLQHATTIYLHPNMARLAEKLASKMPPGLDVTYFVSSGSEANDLAVTLARLYTGNTDVIALRNGYHGGSPSSMGLTSHHTWKLPVLQGPYVHHALCPEPYRSGLGGSPEEIAAAARRRHRGADPLLHPRPHRRVHRRADPGRGRRHLRGAQLFPRGLPDRAGARRALHRRRGADRLRPHRRALLGLPELRRGPRHRHHGQGLRQRRPARGGHHPPRDRGGARPAAPLQHLRREPGVHRGGARGHGRDRGGGPAAQRARWWAAGSRTGSSDSPRCTRSSATCAAWASCSAWSW